MRNHLIIIALLFSFSAFGQGSEEALRNTLDTYFEAVQQKDIATSLDYSYPKLFDIVPKEALEKAMAEMYADTTVLIEFSDSEIKNISKIKKIKGVKYALVTYGFNMTMTMNEAADEEDEDEGLGIDLVEFTAEMLKMQHGEENVTTDKENKQIHIKVESTMYAINDPAYDGWKFLDKKESTAKMIKKILPKKALKKL